MKTVIISAFLFLMTVSCVNKGKTVEQPATKSDSLELVLASKDSVIYDVFESLNQIAANINTIRTRENLVSAYVENVEIGRASSLQINEDIHAIDELLVKNRQTIKRLENSIAELKRSNIHIPSLEALIVELNSQAQSKDIEIDRLKDDIGKIATRVAELSTTVDSLSDKNIKLEDDMKITSDVLNTAYYIVGSQKELLDKQVIYKSGFIGKTLKINENRSLDDFTQVDIRKLDEIIVGKQNVRIIGSHPDRSYEMVMKDNKTTSSIVILDKNAFWEYSKVLVVVYK